MPSTNSVVPHDQLGRRDLPLHLAPDRRRQRIGVVGLQRQAEGLASGAHLERRARDAQAPDRQRRPQRQPAVRRVVRVVHDLQRVGLHAPGQDEGRGHELAVDRREDGVHVQQLGRLLVVLDRDQARLRVHDLQRPDADLPVERGHRRDERVAVRVDQLQPEVEDPVLEQEAREVVAPVRVVQVHAVGQHTLEQLHHVRTAAASIQGDGVVDRVARQQRREGEVRHGQVGLGSEGHAAAAAAAAGRSDQEGREDSENGDRGNGVRAPAQGGQRHRNSCRYGEGTGLA